MPPRNERVGRAAGRDPYAPKRRDGAAVAEGVHAQQANRGWRRFRLRGQVKARAGVCRQALGHDLLCLPRRGVAPAGAARAA